MTKVTCPVSEQRRRENSEPAAGHETRQCPGSLGQEVGDDRETEDRRVPHGRGGRCPGPAEGARALSPGKRTGSGRGGWGSLGWSCRVPGPWVSAAPRLCPAQSRSRGPRAPPAVHGSRSGAGERRERGLSQPGQRHHRELAAPKGRAAA